MADNTHYYLGFSHFWGIGPVKFEALIKYFGDVEKAYNTKESELTNIIGSHFAAKFIQFRSQFDRQKLAQDLKKKEIVVLTQENEDYPTSLKNIPDPPICLYVKGNVNNFNFEKDYFIGIVGTRKPTSYGQKIAGKFAYDLSSVGFNIVSGMAVGVDTIAHQSCLEAKGKTVAILGCGVDIIYPRQNEKLYQNIIKSGGLIISEFPPGHTVLKGLFVARNRLISGLSKGVLVIEGAADSGALITARYAAQQGKEVFAPPGPLTSQMSQAPNLLLKQGAKLVTSVEDILEEFNLTTYPKKREMLVSNLNGDEKTLFDVLINEPKAANELTQTINFPISKTLLVLSNLEIRGIIEKNSEGKYQVKN